MKINTRKFGDIDIESHRKFEEKICEAAQISTIMPLWGLDRVTVKNLITNLKQQGKKAVFL